MVQAAALNTPTVPTFTTVGTENLTQDFIVDVPLALMDQGAPPRLIVDFGGPVAANATTAHDTQTAVLNAWNVRRSKWRTDGLDWVADHHNNGWGTANTACVHVHNAYLDSWTANINAAGTLTYNVRTATAATSNWVWNNAPWDKKSIRRARTSQRLRPQLLNHRGEASRASEQGRQFDDVTPAEILALQLLRKMVEPDDFRRYLKHGFVTVKAPSGLVYQIGRRALIKVWDGADMVCTLCVHLKDSSIPPTDAVVAKMLIAELDERDLWKRSNVAWRAAKDRPVLRQLGVA